MEMQLIAVYKAAFPSKPILECSTEYKTFCPYCGEQGANVNKDRFLIDKAKNVFWCRQCKKGGNVKSFAKDFKHLLGASILDAINVKQDLNWANKNVLKSNVYDNRSNTIPSDKWQVEVGKWLKVWQGNLTTQVAQRALKHRFINLDTAQAAGLGFNIGHSNLESSILGLDAGKNIWLPMGLVLPTIYGDKICAIEFRLFPEYKTKSGKSKAHHCLNGSSRHFSFCVGEENDIVVVFESILDALLAWQVSDRDICCIALGSNAIQAGPNVIDKIENCEFLFACIDLDEPGTKVFEMLKGLNSNVELACAYGEGKSAKDLTDCHRLALNGGNADSAESWFKDRILKPVAEKIKMLRAKTQDDKDSNIEKAPDKIVPDNKQDDIDSNVENGPINDSIENCKPPQANFGNVDSSNTKACDYTKDIPSFKPGVANVVRQILQFIIKPKQGATLSCAWIYEQTKLAINEYSDLSKEAIDYLLGKISDSELFAKQVANLLGCRLTFDNSARPLLMGYEMKHSV